MNVWMLKNQKWQSALIEFHEARTMLNVNGERHFIRLYGGIVTGGTYFDYLSSVAANAALLIEPHCLRFALPCRDGLGIPCNDNLNDAVWRYSEDLCCEYQCDDMRHIVTRDTRATLIRKIALACQSKIEYVLLSDRAFKIVTASSF